MPQVLLIRHCQSHGPAPDSPLTDEGHQAAGHLAAYLADYSIDRMISSPFRRAIDTIVPYARSRGLSISQDRRLAERRLSDEPLPDFREFVRESFSDPDLRAPGGESAREALSRGWAAVHEALQSTDSLPVLVSHGQLLSLILNSIDSRFGYSDWLSLRNPELIRLTGNLIGDLQFERLELGDIAA